MLFWDCGNSYGKALNSKGRELKLLSVIGKSQPNIYRKTTMGD